MGLNREHKKGPILYYDHGRVYLELHALRAPLGPYTGRFAEERDPEGNAYNVAVESAVDEFERTNDITLWLLGRSGRHVCIVDSPRNRRRYASLQRKAITAAQAMWADMRAPARRTFAR